MNIGMLWFDNEANKTLAVRVNRAAEYYRVKYGQFPDLVYIHPSMSPEISVTETGIRILTSSQIRPNHFWVGVSEEPLVKNQISFLT